MLHYATKPTSFFPHDAFFSPLISNREDKRISVTYFRKVFNMIFFLEVASSRGRFSFDN